MWVPMSNDSSLSEVTNSMTWANANNAATQFCDISGQLKLGIRAFDIRPVIISTHDDAANADPHVYYTSHLDKAPVL